MKIENQKVIKKQNRDNRNERATKELKKKETKENKLHEKEAEAPIITGLAIGISAANHQIHNDDSENNQDNRRSFIGKFLKASALVGLGSVFALSGTGCEPDDCSCESIGDCKCDEVCTCNKVCTCNPD